jgi:hypothetical protein
LFLNTAVLFTTWCFIQLSWSYRLIRKNAFLCNTILKNFTSEREMNTILIFVKSTQEYLACFSWAWLYLCALISRQGISLFSWLGCPWSTWHPMMKMTRKMTNVLIMYTADCYISSKRRRCLQRSFRHKLSSKYITSSWDFWSKVSSHLRVYMLVHDRNIFDCDSFLVSTDNLTFLSIVCKGVAIVELIKRINQKNQSINYKRNQRSTKCYYHW